MSRWTIGQRIAAGYAILLVLLTVVAGVGMYALATTRDTFGSALDTEREDVQKGLAATKAFTEPRAAVTPAPRPSARVPSPAPAPRLPQPSRPPAVAVAQVPPLERAALEADRGNLDAARDLCVEAVSADRLDPEAYLLLAAVQQERSDLQAAGKAIRRAIYLAPDSASAHFILGSLLRRQGEEFKARRSMETVMTLLENVPADQAVPGADGLTAGRLLETAAAYLEAL